MGTYGILVYPPLQLENNYKQGKRIIDVLLESGANVTEVNIYIKKMGSISGKIFQKDGITPVKPGKIFAANITDSANQEEIILPGGSDTIGDFMIKKIPAGEKWNLLYVNEVKGNTTVYNYDNIINLNNNEDLQNIEFNLGNIGSTKIYGSIKDVNENYINNEFCRVLFRQGEAGRKIEGFTLICKVDNGKYIIQGDIPSGEYNVNIDLFKSNFEGKPVWKINDIGIININQGEQKELNLIYDDSKAKITDMIIDCDF